ncbi:MAG: L,D-transpeptidase [Bauldia sp.]
MIDRRRFFTRAAATAAAGALTLASRRAGAIAFWDEVEQRWMPDRDAPAAAVSPQGAPGAPPSGNAPNIGEDGVDYNRPLPERFFRRDVDYASVDAVGDIVIEPSEYFLYLITGFAKARRYGIGVGREGFGWHGTVAVGDKRVWPTWTPPATMIAREAALGNFLPASMPGGEDNPLGARALYLYQGGKDTLYRIHGTNQPWSIGLNMSSGCFRMMNEDVIDLYDRVKVGAKVIVL